MNQTRTDRLAKLASLRLELESAEKAGGLETWDLALKQSRENLVAIIEKCNNCRFDLGRVLSRYRAHFKADHHWLAAAKVIASALRVSERTDHRILEEYEPASKLPETVVEAMKEQNIDPAAGKNAGLVTELLQTPEPGSRQEAGTIVAEKQQEQVAKKKQKKAGLRSTTIVSRKSVVARIVAQLRNRLKAISPEERDSEVRAILEQVARELGAEFKGGGFRMRASGQGGVFD